MQGRRLPESIDGGTEANEGEVSDDEDEDEEEEKSKAGIKQKKKTKKIAKEWSDCIVMCQNVSFKGKVEGFEYSKKNCKLLTMTPYTPLNIANIHDIIFFLIIHPTSTILIGCCFICGP